MPRPRKVFMGMGRSIVFNNFETTLADRLEALCKNPPEEDKVEDMKDVALSMRLNGKIWEIVTLQYNAEKGRGIVVKVEKVGESKIMAFNRLKLLMMEKGFVP